jgi:cystathionine gamma-synthase
MVVLKPASEWGRAPPPESPYSICTNIRGWDVGVRILQDDYSDLARITHIYPRFSPTLFAAQVSRYIPANARTEW